MNKVIPLKKGTSRKQTVQTVIPGKHLKLPPQGLDEVQLVDTDSEILLALAKPNDFRNLVMALKVKFIQDIQTLATTCDLEVDTKVYFTFKQRE